MDGSLLDGVKFGDTGGFLEQVAQKLQRLDLFFGFALVHVSPPLPAARSNRSRTARPSPCGAGNRHNIISIPCVSKSRNWAKTVWARCSIVVAVSSTPTRLPSLRNLSARA